MRRSAAANTMRITVLQAVIIVILSGGTLLVATEILLRNRLDRLPRMDLRVWRAGS